ncbi:unnamed protein product, partial [Allacma fusca]
EDFTDNKLESGVMEEDYVRPGLRPTLYSIRGGVKPFKGKEVDGDE